MAEMQVDLVAVERKVWSGTAEFVFARTSVGEIGVLPRHEPLIAQLTDAGMVRIDPSEGGESVRAAVFGGFLSMDGEKLTILAEEAELGDEVDVSAAQQERDSASDDDAEGRATKARAEARLAAAGQGSE